MKFMIFVKSHPDLEKRIDETSDAEMKASISVMAMSPSLMQAEEGQDSHHNHNESDKINDPVHSRLRTFPAEMPIITNLLCFQWFPMPMRFSAQQDSRRGPE